MRVLAIALLAVACCGAALADDFLPPDWRGDPLTVLVAWDFDWDFTDDPMNIGADTLVTVGDGIHELNDVFVHAHASATVGWETDPDEPWDGRAYTGDAPGEIDFFLGNWFDEYEFKHIWVQLTFGGQGLVQVVDVVAPNPDTGGWTDPVHGALNEAFQVDPAHRIETWVLMPNPDREHIYVSLPPFSYLDQIVIDTISTNDPIAAEARSWSDVKNLFD